MDVAALSIGMSQAKLGQAVGVSLLKMVKDNTEQQSTEFIAKMLQQSAQPHLGKSVDVRV